LNDTDYRPPADRMSLKEQMILKAEEAVNQQRKRREILEEELAQINAKESEARELLQLLKIGNVPVSNGKPKAPTNEEFLEALETVGAGGEPFTSQQVADLLDMSRGAASQRIRKDPDAYPIVVIKQGAPGVSTIYKLKEK
jgi:hypothetical protein